MSAGYPNYRFAVDTRSITAMNGSTRGYGSSSLDAREYYSLSSQRLSEFDHREEPFHLRGDDMASKRRIAKELSNIDRLFSEVRRR